MRLIRLGDRGAERPAVIGDDGQVFDLAAMTDDIDGPFLAVDGIDRVRDALAAGLLARLDDSGDGSGLRVGAPLARPTAVICIGQNYAAHAAESGSAVPEQPVVFFKHPNTVVGPYDDVVIPRGSAKTDWEVELGVVIGRRLSYADSPADALAAVAGYVTSNDVSERAFQREQSGGQWSKGKCAATFNPLGPWLVPAPEVGDPQRLRLRSSVDGQPRQDSTTADMVFDVAHLLWDLSQYMVLEAGDLVNTGTPEGVAMSGRFPYLAAANLLEVEVVGLGAQRSRLVAAG